MNGECACEFAFSAGLTALTCAAGVWLTAPVLAQQSGEQSNEAEQALVRYVQDVMGGANVPPDVTLTWDPYFVKAEDGQVYVPFTVALPENVLENDVDMHYTVIPKGPRVSMFTATRQSALDARTGAVVWETQIAGEVINTASAPAQNVVITITMVDAEGLSLGTQEATVATVCLGADGCLHRLGERARGNRTVQRRCRRELASVLGSVHPGAAQCRWRRRCRPAQPSLRGPGG